MKDYDRYMLPQITDETKSISDNLKRWINRNEINKNRLPPITDDTKSICSNLKRWINRNELIRTYGIDPDNVPAKVHKKRQEKYSKDDVALVDLEKSRKGTCMKTYESMLNDDW